MGSPRSARGWRRTATWSAASSASGVAGRPGCGAVASTSWARLGRPSGRPRRGVKGRGRPSPAWGQRMRSGRRWWRPGWSAGRGSATAPHWRVTPATSTPTAPRSPPRAPPPASTAPRRWRTSANGTTRPSRSAPYGSPFPSPRPSSPSGCGAPAWPSYRGVGSRRCGPAASAALKPPPTSTAQLPPWPSSTRPTSWTCAARSSARPWPNWSTRCSGSVAGGRGRGFTWPPSRPARSLALRSPSSASR
mmetsp:Transcript_19753/g.34702  ORF Transcript_19753/g.34702 Transcript_19753/m.34702 type:complete len:248 (-) Transcript_19753:832-1575(-)